ncbi:DUF2953 domain-containing protein [Flavonifractor sp. HCP28S3_F3]|uniref:DUF2953 domain-containing protein n=1 Tax=Flavonifractor sp. HCP28S3_F3 TaxID=3438939 RepID=UPI003F89BB9B
MKVLLILALIAVVLVLISLIRIGIQVIYVPSGLTLRLKLGPVRMTLLPRKEKKQSKKKKEPKTAAAEEGKRDVLGQIRRGLPLIAEAAGRLKRKVRLDRIYLNVTAAASDPASAALAFGGVNAAVGMIWPLVEQNFNVRDRRIRTRVDFEATRPTASLDAAATLTIGQTVVLAIWLAPRLPQALGTERKKQTDTVQKEAV